MTSRKPVSILGQPNPVHTPTSQLLEIHPNIIHPSTPRSPQWSLSLRFAHQDPIYQSLLAHTRHMPSPSHSSRFYHPYNIGCAVQVIYTARTYSNNMLLTTYKKTRYQVFIVTITSASQTKAKTRCTDFRCRHKHWTTTTGIFRYSKTGVITLRTYTFSARSQNLEKRVSAPSCLSSRNNSSPNGLIFVKFDIRVLLESLPLQFKFH